MGHRPAYSQFELTRDLAADALSAWLGDPPQVHFIENLIQGHDLVSALVDFGDERQSAIIKVAPQPNDIRIGAEFARIQFMTGATEFPMPQGYYCDLSGTVIPHSYAIYEHLDGVRLDEATFLTPEGRQDIDCQIGEAVASLHKHRAKRFGTIGEALPDGAVEALHWWEWFQGLTRDRLEAARAGNALDSRTIQRIETLTEYFPTIFATRTKPTLIHGNLWAANIIVAPREDGMGELSGFLDPMGIFAHPEMELATLELWQTVGPKFFEEYHHAHDLEEAYPRRKFIYWISALLQNVSGDNNGEYGSALKTLVDQVWMALGKE